ncbi:MAG TPA: periplasmic heavy metal sensor [bacterium]|nr:periplasmic heavy metal sensor [bacterium]
MNRTKTAVVVVIALVGLVGAGLVFARWGQGPMAMNGSTGEKVGQRGFDTLVDKLGLTEDQAEALKAIFDEHHQKMRDIMDAARPVIAAVREELAKDEPNEEALSRLIAQAKAIQEQMKAEMDVFKTRINEFTAGLSVKQQAQFLLFEARMFRRMHQRPMRMMESQGPSGAEKLDCPASCPFTDN